jgi:hypothetical protein
MSSENPYPHLKNFIPLPSNPNVKLTREQLAACLPPENRHVWREVIELTMKEANITGILAETLPQPKSDKDENS